MMSSPQFPSPQELLIHRVLPKVITQNLFETFVFTVNELLTSCACSICNAIRM
jgi:hypothetical protein